MFQREAGAFAGKSVESNRRGAFDRHVNRMTTDEGRGERQKICPLINPRLGIFPVALGVVSDGRQCLAVFSPGSPNGD